MHLNMINDRGLNSMRLCLSAIPGTLIPNTRTICKMRFTRKKARTSGRWPDVLPRFGDKTPDPPDVVTARALERNAPVHSSPSCLGSASISTVHTISNSSLLHRLEFKIQTISVNRIGWSRFTTEYREYRLIFPGHTKRMFMDVYFLTWICDSRCMNAWKWLIRTQSQR